MSKPPTGADIALATLARTPEEPENQPYCADCRELPQVAAVILFPSLGTPLILDDRKDVVSIFIAAEGGANAAFRLRFFRQNKHSRIYLAQTGYLYVDQHLRLYPITGKAIREDTRDGRWLGDGHNAEHARKNIHVWQTGLFQPGPVWDRFDRIVGNLKRSVVEHYHGHAHPYKLSHIYQIDINRSAITVDLTQMHTFAWMIKRTESENHPEAAGVQSWEMQDHIICEFLRRERQTSTRNHVQELYEFDLSQPLKADALPPQKSGCENRLMSWHPVVAKSVPRLKIGHLSDVHINVRHHALCRSDVAVLENPAPGGGAAPVAGCEKVADNLCNSTLALYDLLLNQMDKEADAVVITGDLLDFNRNIDPAKVGDTVAEQWRNYNVMTRLDAPGLYRRGFDSMMMYSLLREACRRNLPVYLTSGNHEAYAIPYGVSPRRNSWMYAMGTSETVGGDAESTNWTNRKVFTRRTRDLADAAESASKWASGKANEGIPADHNLTVYEICLAYGPTYAQLRTSKNFSKKWFDWFDTLYTPLSDWQVEYRFQVLVGLGWGEDENMTNLSGLIGGRADKQSAGILPRANEAFSKHQRALVEQGCARKKKLGGTLLLFSHFTIINYGGGVPFSAKEKSFSPTNYPNFNPHQGPTIRNSRAGWNECNTGTCERGLDWYFDKCVGAVESKDFSHTVDCHFSGHSHRAGVYAAKKIGWVFGAYEVTGAFDPGLQPGNPNNVLQSYTRFVVSSSGGPTGTQNLDAEMADDEQTWHTTPPSGTLLDDTSAPPFRQLAYTEKRGKPRLCVALDYLQIMGVEQTLFFTNHKDWCSGGRIFGSPFRMLMLVGPKTARLNCIDSIRLWGFKAASGSSKSKKSKTGTPAQEGAAQSEWKVFELPFKLIAKKAGSRLVEKLVPNRHDLTLQALEDEGITYTDHPDGAEAFAAYEVTIPGELYQANLEDICERWFCEVALKPPALEPLSDNFDTTTPWRFPVEVGLISRRVTLVRKRGEFGEVPDWQWLWKKFPARYSDPLKVITESDE